MLKDLRNLSFTKRLADSLTMIRALLVIGFVWLGLEDGRGRLPAAIWMLILSWTSDAMDGPLARRSQPPAHTWLGDHDLEIDMLASLGLLSYMLLAGFVSLTVVLVYLLFWLLIFLRFGTFRSLGMLSQAPIYAGFILLAMQEVPKTGIWLIVWVTAALIITWPRFPNEVVPGFLGGMKDVWRNPAKRES